MTTRQQHRLLWLTRDICRVVTCITMLTIGQGLGKPAWSQTSGIGIGATVLSSLSATAVSDLDFGLVFPGGGKSITANNPLSGAFVVQGIPGQEIGMFFILPTELTAGGEAIPFFGGSDKGGRNTANSRFGMTIFDPELGDVTNLPANGTLYLFVGGFIPPIADPTPGTYTGEIVLGVVYLGS